MPRDSTLAIHGSAPECQWELSKHTSMFTLIIWGSSLGDLVVAPDNMLALPTHLPPIHILIHLMGCIMLSDTYGHLVLIRAPG